MAVILYIGDCSVAIDYIVYYHAVHASGNWWRAWVHIKIILNELGLNWQKVLIYIKRVKELRKVPINIKIVLKID
jgi:hypothetical protein